MSVQKKLIWLIFLLILGFSFSGCQVWQSVSDRAELSVSDSDDSAQVPDDSGASADAVVTETPEAEPTIGEGIGGGALEDGTEVAETDDSFQIAADALATSLALTLEAWPTNTPIVITNTPGPESPTATVAQPTDTPTPEPGDLSPTVPAEIFTELAQTLTAIVVSSTPTLTPVGGAPTESSGTTTVVVVDDDAVTGTPEADSDDDDVPCLALRFVADGNYEDGSAVQTDQIFFKQWYVQNVGSCRWETDFRLVELDIGEALGASISYSLDTIVYPGQYVTLTAQMVAPSYSGYYTSYWGLTDDKGEFFGVVGAAGETYDQPFWVQIYVWGDSAPPSGGAGSGGGVVVTAPPFTPGP